MKIEQIYTKCLSATSYMVSSQGEAVVIDPIREPDAYLEMAEEMGVRITHILETHFHADFVSGHLELQRKTGAQIVFGPNAKPSYPAHIAEDGEKLAVGKLTFEVLHTPGHTPESITYLLRDEAGEPHAIFTGDTLFMGDVGRPDLAVKSELNLTMNDLAGMLYNSLHNKIMPLPDSVIVYPAHGAGSSCGKNIGSELSSTLGQQKHSNYALQPMSRERFIEVVTEGLGAPPNYFFDDARINKEGYEDVDAVLERAIRPLTVAQVEGLIQEGALVLDTRDAADFARGHLPGAMNIGLGGQYAIWVGTLIPITRTVIVVADPGKQDESILRMARIGYHEVAGYLDGGASAWTKAGKELETTKSVSPETAAVAEGRWLDVRKPGEFADGHLEGAAFLTLQDLPERFTELPKNVPYKVHCAGGYRSMIASSILQAQGYQVTNVEGGFGALKPLGLPLAEGALA